MCRRHAFTLLELLVVIAILSLLAAIVLPAYAKTREKGRQTACISNLRQVGVALALYRSDYDEMNTRHRLCPDLPTLTEQTCDGASPTVSTGPNETWWAPYDNTISPEPADGPPPSGSYTGVRAGLLRGYARTLEIFRCPSYPQGQAGYAMSYVTAGPMGRPDADVANPGVLFVWDHARTPGCADTRALPHAVGTPWEPFPPNADANRMHYPFRHTDGFVGLRYDGGAKFRKPASLTDADFDATRTP